MRTLLYLSTSSSYNSCNLGFLLIGACARIGSSMILVPSVLILIRVSSFILSLVGHPNYIFSVAFSPDGTKIVSSCWGDQNNLIIWDAITGKRLCNLAGHLKGVESVAFSPDGTKIVSGGGGDQNNLLVWTLLTDKEELVLKRINNYTAEQIRLIYQLCSELAKGSIKQLAGDRLALYQTLPQEMQLLLNNIFWPKKGWFSGWW